MFEYAMIIGGVPLVLGAGVFLFLKKSAHNVQHFSMAMTIGVMLPILFHLLLDTMGHHNHDHAEIAREHGDEHGQYWIILLENLLVWLVMAAVFAGLHYSHRLKLKFPPNISLGLGGTLAVAAAFHHIPEGILMGDIVRNNPEQTYRTILGLSLHHFAEALAIVSLMVYENKSLKNLGVIAVILIIPLYCGMSFTGYEFAYLTTILSAIGAGALAHVIFDTVLYLQTTGKQCCSNRLIYSGYVVGIVFSVVINGIFETHL